MMVQSTLVTGSSNYGTVNVFSLLDAPLLRHPPSTVYDTALPVKFRIFSPVGDVAFEDRTVSFIIACAYFPPDGEPVELEGIRQDDRMRVFIYL